MGAMRETDTGMEAELMVVLDVLPAIEPDEQLQELLAGDPAAGGLVRALELDKDLATRFFWQDPRFGNNTQALAVRNSE